MHMTAILTEAVRRTEESASFWSGQFKERSEVPVTKDTQLAVQIHFTDIHNGNDNQKPLTK